MGMNVDSSITYYREMEQKRSTAMPRSATFRRSVRQSDGDCPQRARFLAMTRDEREADKLARTATRAKDVDLARRAARRFGEAETAALLDAAEAAYCSRAGSGGATFKHAGFTCWQVHTYHGMLMVTCGGTAELAMRPFDSNHKTTRERVNRLRREKRQAAYRCSDR